MNSLVVMGGRRERLLPMAALAIVCGCGSDFSAQSGELVDAGGRTSAPAGGAAGLVQASGGTAGTSSPHPAAGGAAGVVGSDPGDAGAIVSCVLHGTATAFASWTSGDGGPPSSAVDGNPSTRWTSGAPRATGQWFELDLQAPLELERLTLRSSRTTDMPAAVVLKLDGQMVPATATSSAGTLELAFAAHKATAVRLELEQAATDWWSIDELSGECLQ